SLFFFFQAEDGIRDRNVTGVQTCALPISYLLYLHVLPYTFNDSSLKILSKLLKLYFLNAIRNTSKSTKSFAVASISILFGLTKLQQCNATSRCSSVKKSVFFNKSSSIPLIFSPCNPSYSRNLKNFFSPIP